MQGVEAVNRIVFNYPEQTVFEPSQVNAQKNKFVECAKQGHWMRDVRHLQFTCGDKYLILHPSLSFLHLSRYIVFGPSV